MTLKPETMAHDAMYNVKYKQPHTLYESVSSEALKQIRYSCVMFEVITFVAFGLYLKSFHSLERHIRELWEMLIDIERNLDHKFMEQNLSTFIDQIKPLGVVVSAHNGVHYQFHTLFLKIP